MDAEFAFEIGSGLLTEVRRLQSLLGEYDKVNQDMKDNLEERDKVIQDTKEAKEDLERIVESLKTTIRQNDKMIGMLSWPVDLFSRLTHAIDELRSTNWDLEVNVRNLQTRVTDLQGSIQRLESEHKRFTNLLTTAETNTNTKLSGYKGR